MADQETPATGDTPTTDTSAGAPSPDPASGEAAAPPPAKKAAAKKATAKKTATRKTAAKKTTAKKAAPAAEDTEAPAQDQAATAGEATGTDEAAKPAKKAAAKRPAKRTTKKAAAAPAEDAAASDAPDGSGTAQAPGTIPLFQPPEQVSPPPRKRAAKKTAPAEDQGDTATAATDEAAEEKPRSGNRSGSRGGTRSGASQEQRPDTEQAAEPADADPTGSADTQDDSGEEGGEGSGRRRRRRGGRRRRKSGGDPDGGDPQSGDSGDDGDSTETESSDGDAPSEGASSRRRRKRRREGDGSGTAGDDPEQTVTRVRKPRSAEDEITAVSGSTRLEAKKQRRREGREAGRRRAPIVSEAEFLARRESVDRVMVIRQRDDLTQIGVLEDKVLVEHYVARESQTSLIGNVYLGRVQNVLPSMEAAFIDIGKGRNAVLYAGEVNWSALGHKEGTPRKIESVLTSGQTVLVQVTKDPIGHKGARLTSQVSLAGRFLVYVPDGTTSGISRKLPDTERSRLKSLLKDIVPDTAGVIVRTAAEGASEEELTRDVERLKARWEDIEGKVKGSAPKLLYGEPDLTLKVVRDLFTEDFTKLVIQGEDAWDTVHGYVTHVAPDLADRLERYEPEDGRPDVFAAHRIDEQIAKALDRKVWLPSGGSLIIDRTEAMTVVDVNTGKFTGSGGNLEETVTKNNLEAAEEVVRQLRLRDIGGIIVVDFIDMVLESNRDLVLRRLVECLGRDRTRHQVAEVTSLGLVQMTRKRIGTGLLEAFSESCDHCQGRGLKLHDMPVEPKKGDDEGRRGGRRRGGRGRNGSDDENGPSQPAPTPKDVAAMARPDRAEDAPSADEGAEDRPAEDRRGGRSARSRTGAHRSDQDAPEPSTDPQPAEQPEAESADKPAPRKRSARRAAGPPAAVEPSGSDQSDQADQADAEPGEAPQQPAPVVEKPQVVTRTRKRAAGRPATPKQTAEPSREDPSTEPAAAEQPGEETPEEPPVVVAPEQPAPVVEKPQVVTRTRRRAASRPAGPPSAGAETDSAGAPADAVDAPAPLEKLAEAGHVGQPADHGMVEPGVAAREPGPEGADTPEGEEPSVVEHVPIKKKGSRKR